MKEKLRNLPVGKKLQTAFRRILEAFIVAIVVALLGSWMINANVKRFYNEAYKSMELQLEIRRDIQLVGKNVLWAITAVDGEQQEKLDDAVTYAARVEENVKALEGCFHDASLVAALETNLQTLKAERIKVTDLVAAGKSEEALELFNGAYDVATENMQNCLIEIGDSADAQVTTAYTRISNLVVIIVLVLVIVGIISSIRCNKLSKTITDMLLQPIHQLRDAAKNLKAGTLDIEISYNSPDELGELAEDFREACTQMRTVIEDMEYLLGGMAEGNFDVHTGAEEYYVGDFELLITSIRKMNRQLNDTLGQMHQTSEQVMAGSGQLADSAQLLAEGAAEQAGAVEELMATIGNVANLADESAQNVEQAADAAKSSAEDAKKSREEMNALTEAMDRINVTSKEIENIIAAIEEIASQTNLLSLNASIEAARAGEAGRGFAVVADQIGKLANDSAKSAITTRELIGKSLDEIEKGNHIVEQTMEMITAVLESIVQFANMVTGSAEASKTQASMLKQVEAGVEQISAVVENNSASAQETLAVSEELSTRAQILDEMVAKFKLRS
ncbi:MAG: MCP four helix bundle domain-containing protein [Lachnospiraceae bacterium]|nr:MCP four helix bundle domain-containing protein [Lachnospiraceae bacterium]